MPGTIRAFLKKCSVEAMPQYLIKPGGISGKQFLLEGAEAAHAALSARLRRGDSLKLFDGAGTKYLAVISDMSAGRVCGKILESFVCPQPRAALELCFSAVSRAASETIIYACTQLGADIFTPVVSERADKTLLKKWAARKDRFAALALSACKQCERAFLPEIAGPAALADISPGQGEPVFMALERSDCGASIEIMSRVFEGSPRKVRILTGPEGGFTAGEVEAAVKRGALAFSLGPYILRAETACQSACAILGALRNRQLDKQRFVR